MYKFIKCTNSKNIEIEKCSNLKIVQFLKMFKQKRNRKNEKKTYLTLLGRAAQLGVVGTSRMGQAHKSARAVEGWSGLRQVSPSVAYRSSLLRRDLAAAIPGAISTTGKAPKTRHQAQKLQKREAHE